MKIEVKEVKVEPPPKEYVLTLNTEEAKNVRDFFIRNLAEDKKTVDCAVIHNPVYDIYRNLYSALLENGEG